jgi:hypothetical protein
MCEFTELLPETKSVKHGALVWEPAADRDGYIPLAGHLTLTGKRCHCRYKVEEFPADFGRGFMLFKLDAGSDKTEERYACVVGASGGLCECRGFQMTGACKHLAALTTLIRAGKL